MCIYILEKNMGLPELRMCFPEIHLDTGPAKNIRFLEINMCFPEINMCFPEIHLDSCPEKNIRFPEINMCLPEKHMRDNMAATCRNFQVLSRSWSKSEMGFGICLAVGQSPKWVPRFVPQLVEFRDWLRDLPHSWSKSEVGCGMLCR